MIFSKFYQIFLKGDLSNRKIILKKLLIPKKIKKTTKTVILKGRLEIIIKSKKP